MASVVTVTLQNEPARMVGSAVERYDNAFVSEDRHPSVLTIKQMNEKGEITRTLYFPLINIVHAEQITRDTKSRA